MYGDFIQLMSFLYVKTDFPTLLNGLTSLFLICSSVRPKYCIEIGKLTMEVKRRGFLSTLLKLVLRDPLELFIVINCFLVIRVIFCGSHLVKARNFSSISLLAGSISFILVLLRVNK